MTLTSDAGGTVQGVAANASSVTYTIFGDEITQGVTGGAVSSVEGRIGVVTLGDLYQPLDSDLTAIAALTTTTFGRSLLALADAAAGRTAFATAPQVTTFLSGSGNYTIPTGAVMIAYDLMGGGGGGGSGRRGSAGTVRCGAGSGSPGGRLPGMILASELLLQYPTGVVPHVVGAGGNGGAAVTVNDTNGSNGSLGSGTSFGQVFVAGGNQGSGGTATTGNGASATSGLYLTLAGVSASTTGGVGTNGLNVGAGLSGGSGGGVTSADVPGAGGGGRAGLYGAVSGAAGAVGGASPTAGSFSVSSPGGSAPGPSPGGGAASITTAAQAGADALANSGAGGSGGGASLNGNNSGAGGNGGSGYLRVVAYF